MPRPHASVPPDAIRIEDEVWQEAFLRREPARPRREPYLHAIDGGRMSSASAVTEREPAAWQRRPVAESHAQPARPRPPRTAAAHRPASLPSDPVAPPVPPATLLDEAPAAGGIPGRRTVKITGYGAERNLPWLESQSRRPQRRRHERSGFQPDRVAMWAVMLGILLVIVALASPH